MINKSKYLVFLLLVVTVACNESPKKPVEVSKQEMKQSMETANRYLLNEEQEEIESYVSRHGLEMKQTGTGLRYQVLKQGTGKQIEKGDMVSLEYQLHSLKGDLIYSSENDGVKTFKVGDGSVETGLDEAVACMHYGDAAKLIIPYHLAYGLHGDDNRIPEYATLVYTIKIKDNQ